MTIATVLFVHGLESGPHGRKARALAAAGFTVVAAQMPCGRAHIVRDPVAIAGAALAVGAVAIAVAQAGVIGAIVAAGVAGAALPVAGVHVMRRVVRRSLAVQVDALASHAIDAVVGSSFGGAIALALVTSGAWSGPTVLLCPAHALVAQRARRPRPAGLAALPTAQASRIVVVHGRRDAVVPLADSAALVRGSAATLIEVDDDHRLAATATADQLAAWLALAARGGAAPRSPA